MIFVPGSMFEEGDAGSEDEVDIGDGREEVAVSGAVEWWVLKLWNGDGMCGVEIVEWVSEECDDGVFDVVSVMGGAVILIVVSEVTVTSRFAIGECL